MVAGDHEFGNQSTDLKLSIVENYLHAFTSALRGKFPELWYIDAFAGTGERTVKTKAVPALNFLPAIDETIERRRGSARIALDVTPQFDRIVFMDKMRRHCRALESLKSDYPGREVDIVRGDANSAILAELKEARWIGKRAVMFLDPYGMEVDWSTLEAIRATEAIDVWYLVSLAGLFRQAARDPKNLTPKKRAALTRMLGTDEWETEWYRYTPPAEDLISGIDERHQRVAEVDAMEQFVGRRLKGLFPAVVGPRRLLSDRNVPAFSLFLAISNPEPKAIGLATKIGNYIIKAKAG